MSFEQTFSAFFVYLYQFRARIDIFCIHIYKQTAAITQLMDTHRSLERHASIS